MGSTAQYDPEEPLLEEEIEEERQQIIVVTLKALIMEFIGSAILASAAFMALRPGSGLGDGQQELAIAALLLTAVYMGAEISGSQYNPAVTLSLLICRANSPLTSLCYIISQTLGCMIGATTMSWLTAPHPVAHPVAHLNPYMWVVEMCFTFALCYVTLHVAVAPCQKGNHYFGVAVVCAAASGFGAHATMNPALAIALALVGRTSAGLWPRVVLPCLGALAASVFFGFSRADDEADRLFYRLMRWTPLSLREALTRWRWPTLLRIVDPLQMEFFGLCMATLAAALALQRHASPAMPSAFVFLEFVFAGGYVSGAHFNPMITLAMSVRNFRPVDAYKLVSYASMQILGALLGGELARLSADAEVAAKPIYPRPGEGFSGTQALMAEALVAMLWTLLYMHMAVPEHVARRKTRVIGYVIGALNYASIVLFGPISRSTFNAAVSIGLYWSNCRHADDLGHLYIYLLGPLLGTIFGIVLFALTEPVTPTKRANQREQAQVEEGVRRPEVR